MLLTLGLSPTVASVCIQHDPILSEWAANNIFSSAAAQSDSPPGIFLSRACDYYSGSIIKWIEIRITSQFF